MKAEISTSAGFLSQYKSFKKGFVTEILGSALQIIYTYAEYGSFYHSRYRLVLECVFKTVSSYFSIMTINICVVISISTDKQIVIGFIKNNIFLVFYLSSFCGFIFLQIFDYYWFNLWERSIDRFDRPIDRWILKPLLSRRL